MSETSHTTAPDAPAAPDRLVGLLVEFDSPGALITAAERVRDAGFSRWDTHSPFPLHGIDEAMGIRRTRLPWLVFGLGLLGCAAGIGLQWWTNGTGASGFPGLSSFIQGYNYVISGKPQFSLPANIPVAFETTVLGAALAAVFGMLVFNNLPWHHNPLFNSERFRRVTTDRFFLMLEARDPRFEAAGTESFAGTLGGVAVERVTASSAPVRWPRGITIAIVVLASLALWPPLLIAKARLTTSTQPRIHVVQDMDNQERFKAQQPNSLFRDGRADRGMIPGTIARGDWPRDPHLYEGLVNGEPATLFPPQVTLDEAFVRRGQERFNIYCAPCHGLGGAGDGSVAERALRLDTPGWVPPTSLHDELVRQRPVGHLFNTITRGVRSMPPYGDQIPPADRWAIIAYVRALQFSQHAPRDEVPQESWPPDR